MLYPTYDLQSQGKLLWQILNNNIYCHQTNYYVGMEIKHVGEISCTSTKHLQNKYFICLIFSYDGVYKREEHNTMRSTDHSDMHNKGKILP